MVPDRIGAAAGAARTSFRAANESGNPNKTFEIYTVGSWLAASIDPQTLQCSYDVALTRYTATRRYGSSVLLGCVPPI